MNDDDLLRYSRHLLLDDIGIEGQRRLLAAHALVDRRRRPRLAGGALPRHGRCRPDHDRRRRPSSISPTCSDRSPTTWRASACPRRSRRRGRSPPSTRRYASPRCTSAPIARVCVELVADADVVVDCSDNFATRQAVNAACVAHARPLVAGAAIGFDGQVSVYDTRDRGVAVLCLRVPARPVFRRRRLRDDGRVRAAGGHHRQHAGRRGVQAPRRHRQTRSSAACRCSTRARWSGPRFASAAMPAAAVCQASASRRQTKKAGECRPLCEQASQLSASGADDGGAIEARPRPGQRASTHTFRAPEPR